MPEYPRDRFDRVPTDLARVGAHRAPRRRGGALVGLAWAALATGLLVGAGLFVLQNFGGGLAGPGAAPTTASAAPGAEPTVDPEVEVVVLNATTTTGLAAEAETVAERAGWNVTSIANASSTDVRTSTVYYTEEAQAGAAAGLAESLAITRTALSEQFAVEGRERLTVVLGADYAAR